MKIISRAVFAAILPIALTLSACGGNSSSMPNPTQKSAGFLPDYSLLKQVPNAPEGSEIYIYKSPSVHRGDYRAVMISPVVLYQTATANGVQNDQIESARAGIQAGIEKIVSQQMPLTHRAGPGVANLTIAITGATVDGEGLKPRNILPISAVIFLASKAADKDQKTPSLMIELKFTDSVTGQLLKETVTVIHGDTFRNTTNTSQEFQALAEQWVQEAMKYSASAGH